MSVLDITNLRKSFISPEGTNVDVIDIPEFSLQAGDQVALEGESGSGKTTFLNLVAGILSPDSGQIMVAGLEMNCGSESLRDTIRARHLGYVFQTFNLLNGYSALENVLLGMAFGKGLDTGWARHLLKRVGLSHRLDYRPPQLSVGQQQRVALARALANRPDLVIADEPTANLDRNRSREAIDLLREICGEGQAALLLVSHDPAVLGMFDKVGKMTQLNRVACGGDVDGHSSGVVFNSRPSMVAEVGGSR